MLAIVLNIAFALGMAFSSLYRWAKVAAAYPPEVFEDREAMRTWAQKAYGTALRARRKSSLKM